MDMVIRNPSCCTSIEEVCERQSTYMAYHAHQRGISRRSTISRLWWTQEHPEECEERRRKILIHGRKRASLFCILHKSPNPVLALDGRFGTLGSSLLVVNTSQTGRLEEQTGVLAFLQHMAQVTSVRRISVVLDILSAGRVGESVLELRAGCGRSSALDAVDGVCVALEDARDGGLGVVAGGEFAAGGLDGCDGFGAGAADDDFDGGGEFLGAAGEQLDAVFDAVDAA
jgi:hypothetical protein